MNCINVQEFIFNQISKTAALCLIFRSYGMTLSETAALKVMTWHSGNSWDPGEGQTQLAPKPWREKERIPVPYGSICAFTGGNSSGNFIS